MHMTGEHYPSLDQLLLPELPRDRELARAFFDNAALQDAPISNLVAQVMQAGALRQAEPAFVSGQRLAMAEHVLVWPAFLPGEKAGASLDAIAADCVDMFLARYGPDG